MGGELAAVEEGTVAKAPVNHWWMSDICWNQWDVLLTKEIGIDPDTAAEGDTNDDKAKADPWALTCWIIRRFCRDMQRPSFCWPTLYIYIDNWIYLFDLHTKAYIHTYIHTYTYIYPLHRIISRNTMQQIIWLLVTVEIFTVLKALDSSFGPWFSVGFPETNPVRYCKLSVVVRFVSYTRSNLAIHIHCISMFCPFLNMDYYFNFGNYIYLLLPLLTY